MCDPVSATMGVLGVGGAIMQADAAGDQADAQRAHNQQLAITRARNYAAALDYQRRLSKWQNDNYYETVKSVQKSTRGQYAAVIEQIDQTRDATAQSIAKAGRTANAASSFIRTSAGQTGTTGNSVLLAQQQAELAEGRFNHNAFTNLRNKAAQGQRNLYAIQAHGQSLINRAMPAPMAPPNLPQPVAEVSDPGMLPFVLQGASSVMGAVAYQQQIDTAAGDPWQF